MITVERYTPAAMTEWNALVAAARNGTFLFDRGYMDYHADRFADHSLIYRRGGAAVAVMPGNERGDEYFSHGGLTYGGVVCSPKLHLEELGEVFGLTFDYLKSKGFRSWHYKQVPSCFHREPCEDDGYWLWRWGAMLERHDISQCAPLPIGSRVAANKRNCHNKLLRMGYSADFDAPLSDFWPVLEANLIAAHNARPVHSLAEMHSLQSRFPDCIKCCTAVSPEGEVTAGTVLYLTDTVVHAQYLSASPRGKAEHAMDFLITHVMQEYSLRPQFRFFDFGTSMLPSDHMRFDGGLARQKEEFGAHGVAYRQYRINLI